MNMAEAGAFVFLTGITLCGVCGSLFELMAGARLSFAAPFFDRLHKLRFACAVVTAGPFMLGNDALAAWREGRIELAGLVCCAVTVLAWAFAMGVALVGVWLSVSTAWRPV